ncbi:MAG: MBL fold metallo-hydrolase [Spirochaetales bacterium]|nr:MBL fold metallo-hydrolase [Spirochaetales bacterium]
MKMKISQFSPSLFTVNMGFVRAYLIKGDDQWALVDTGIPGKGRELLDEMEKAGLTGPISRIILTQLHGDHVGSLKELKDLTGAQVLAHAEEAPAIEEGLTMRPCVPGPGPLKWLVHRLFLKGGKPSYLEEGTPVDVHLKGGEVIPLGPGAEVIHTPGHTAGHICLLLKEEGGILIAGDAAAGGKKPGFPMLFEDEAAGRESLKRLGDLTFRQAVFGHGKALRSEASAQFRRAFT